MSLENDFYNSESLQDQLKKALFVVAFSIYDSPLLRQYAHVILPITPYTENSGTFINIEHRWQTFEAAVAPLNESRPGWKVLRVLGNFLKSTRF